VQLLNNKNLLIYAAQNYSNPTCRSTEEFMEDLRRLKYLRKLITRYKETGELKERLILNHIIILSNVFASEPLCRILFLKMETVFDCVKPFLVGLDIMIDRIVNVGRERIVQTEFIPMDQHIVEKIRPIFNATVR